MCNYIFKIIVNEVFCWVIRSAYNVPKQNFSVKYITYFKFIGKKKFTYRGCGWKSIDIRSWSEDTKSWIMMINDLFKQIFGDDFLMYRYCKEHGTSVDEKVASSILEYSHEHWELQYAKVFSNDVDWEGDSPQDENNSFCSPGVKVETEHAHIKKDALEDSASSEDAVCEGSSGSFLDDSLVIGPISPDVTEKKEDSDSILHDAMAKAKTRAEVAALFSLLPPVSTKCSSTTALSPYFGSPSGLPDPCDLNECPCESLVKKAQERFTVKKRWKKSIWCQNCRNRTIL